MSKDFVDMLRALLEKDVRFLVVGAYAMAAHGLPRATADLDVWVEPSQENAGRVWNALTRFGAPLGGIVEGDFAHADSIYQMGVPPNRIDVITSISGVSFSGAWPRRIFVVVAGMPVPFLGADDLLANKKAAGRPKDLLDVETLTRFANRKFRPSRPAGR